MTRDPPSANVERMLRLVIVLSLLAGVARATEPTAASALATAAQKLEDGDYDAVVATLAPIAESGAVALPNKLDRIEALRAYGIACTLSQRRAAAEGAFMLLLDEKPDFRFDPRLVRPEAVTLLESVRAHFPPLPPTLQPPSLTRPSMPPLRKAGYALFFVGIGTAAAGVIVGLTSLATALNEPQVTTGDIVGAALGGSGVVMFGVGIGLIARSKRHKR